jgi:hypothetical protein
VAEGSAKAAAKRQASAEASARRRAEQDARRRERAVEGLGQDLVRGVLGTLFGK